MSFFQQLYPGYIPESIARQGELQILREKILQGMLLVICPFGLAAVILATRTMLQSGNLAFVFLYWLVYTLLVANMVLRSLPYRLRGMLLITLIYVMAVSELFESGQLGEVRMFLVCFTAITAVLFSRRYVVGSIILGQSTIAAAGIYASTGHPTGGLANFFQGTNWITSSVIFLLLCVLVSSATTTIIAGLARILIKMADLNRDLESDRNALEARIQERTRSNTRRINQLRTAAEITRTISGLSDPEKMLPQVVDLIRDRFDLYYVGIFLLDTGKQNAVLQAGTGEAGRQMIAAGHQLAVGGSSMIGWSIANREARIALDVGSEAVRFNNPYLPLTRSEMAIPILAYDEIRGALTIQSKAPNAFDEDDVTILQSIADSLAIAIENDRLFRETREALDEVRLLNREYLQRAWAETIQVTGELSFEYENPAIEESTGDLRTLQVPMKLRDQVVGSITLELDRPGLTQEESTFIENISTQTAIALENARLLHETERRAVQEQRLNELTTRFSRAISIEEILKTAVQELGQLPAVADVAVHLNPVEPVIKTVAAPLATHANGKEHAT